MSKYGFMSAMRRWALVGGMGTTFALGGCDLGEFTTTTTTTLSGREVVSYLVRSAILTPVQNFVDDRIDNFFDEIEGEDDD